MAKEAAMIELVWDIIRGRTDGISKVTYFPQKPVFPSEIPFEQPFERAAPESQGVDSGQMRGMLKELQESKTLHMHNVMVLKNGKVIGEAGFYPYQKDLWHMTYSMSKSVVSMAIGFLIGEGKLNLDTKVVDVFKKNISLFGLIRQKDLTVEHLLTMTSGVALNEIGAVSGNDWVKSFLEAPVHHGPGEVFEYNSMNSYMLSAIVTELTGEKLTEYLKPRLFEPLGITRVFWESCPKGINKGGWGLYLCVEDMAKLGQLYLDGGKWKGRQVIPEEWVEASTTTKVVPPEDTGFIGYGYQIWMCQRPGSFAFNGMMGQNVFLYPDLQMVIVTTAGNEVFFNSNELQEVLERYLPDKNLEVLPENLAAYQKLRRFQQKVSQPYNCQPRIQGGGWHRKRQGPEGWKQKAEKLSGRKFVLQTVQVGLLPLMGQVFHNNYTGGIQKIGFSMEDGQFYLDILEGEVAKKVPVGFQEEAVFDLDLNGELYRVAVCGKFSTDEDEREVLTVVLSYLEDSMKRVLKFFFHDHEVEVRFREVPGKAIILDGISSITAAIMENPLLKKFKEKGNVDLIRMVMENTIEPMVIGEEEKE